MLLLCRDRDAGEATAAELSAEGPGSAELLWCDLAGPAAIADAAAEVSRRVSRLDVLVNNAGLYSPLRVETIDGLELMFAVNYLGGFRLTHHLMALLVADGGGRVVNLSSRSHAEGRLVLDDLSRERRRWSAYGAYSDSKLAVLLGTVALSRRLEGTGVVANCVHPGVVGTGFAQDEPGALGALFRLALPLMLRPSQGADSVLWLAGHPDAGALRGAYVVRRRARRPARVGRDVEGAERLWEESLRLAGPLPLLSGP